VNDAGTMSLDAIAIVIIGGTSLFGGCVKGAIVTGAVAINAVSRRARLLHRTPCTRETFPL
jgi:predicted ABC-type sugar transport system permease subunit